MSSKTSVATSWTSKVNGLDSGFRELLVFGFRSGGSEKPGIGGSCLACASVNFPGKSFWRRRNWMDVGRSCVTMKFRRRSGMSEYRRVASGRITIHWTFGSLPRMRRFFTETRPGQVETASSQSIRSPRASG